MPTASPCPRRRATTCRGCPTIRSPSPPPPSAPPADAPTGARPFDREHVPAGHGRDGRELTGHFDDEDETGYDDTGTESKASIARAKAKAKAGPDNTPPANAAPASST